MSAALSVEGDTRVDLTPETRSWLARPAPERIAAVRRGTWIPYPRAQEALSHLRYALEQPPSPRMTGLTVAGPTNNGKTTIIREFIATHRSTRDTRDAEQPEFLYVETPPSPKPGALYAQILRAVGDPLHARGTETTKLNRVLHVVPQLRPRMLFLDEIHNVLAGSPKQCESFLNSLKYLANQLTLPVVLVGTEAAVNVIRTDPQVSSRYPPFSLLPWAADEQFARLVGMVLATLPLRRRSTLSATALKHLHTRSAGALGGVVQILQRAAVCAVESGAEEITARSLETIDFG